MLHIPIPLYGHGETLDVNFRTRHVCEEVTLVSLPSSDDEDVVNNREMGKEPKMEERDNSCLSIGICDMFSSVVTHLNPFLLV